MCFTIDEIKEKTVPIVKSYGISKVGLFGSYARGDALGCHVDVCLIWG